ncbi:MAG: hypothetical protein E8D46_03260 [Nitrospira sp.]|nr:MAG: hypothetical protein E8D46_03260 [Nitrospira sp.]
MALLTRSLDLSLEQIPAVSHAFEIHKYAGGSVMLVGFVEANVKPQVTAREKSKRFCFGLYVTLPIRPHKSLRYPWVSWLSIGCDLVQPQRARSRRLA